MAEGPQVARWAKQLRAFVGEPLLFVQLPRRLADDAARLVGEHVVETRSHGKHLLVGLSTGETMHCHAMMYGSWQIGEAGLTPRKDESRVRVRLITPTHEALFFNGPVVELLTPEQVAGHRTLPKLGPDVLWEPFDRDDAHRRVVAQSDRPIGDTLLDQMVLSGIGNIYKSEGLLVAGIDPRRPSSSISRAELDRLWDRLLPVMRAASEPGGRMFPLPAELAAAGYRRWVYKRRGQPCLQCGAPVQLIRQGALQRTTYFCELCQPMNPATTAGVTEAAAVREPL